MKKRILSSFLILIITVSFAVAIVPVFAQLYDGWEFRIDVSIDHTLIAEDLTDFPVYLEISNSSGITNADLTPIFDEIGNNYTQMLVTTEDLVSCYTEVVPTWNDTLEYAELWIKVPYISNEADTQLRVYYGADHSPNNLYIGLTGSNVAEQVWDSNFKLVSHMNDDPDTSHIMDSTSNDNDGTKKAANEPIEATGKIGKAQEFDYSDDYIGITNNADFEEISKFTIEAWIEPDSLAGAGYGIFGHDNYDNFLGYIYQDDIYLRVSTTGAYEYYYKNNALNAGFKHIVITYDFTAGEVNFFVDNIKYSTEGAGIVNPITNAGWTDLRIGVAQAPNTRLFDGIIDEVRFIKGVVRSDAWVGASYQTQNDSLLTVGAPITEPPAPTSGLVLFGFLGFIIAICALALVMANKKR